MNTFNIAKRSLVNSAPQESYGCLKLHFSETFSGMILTRKRVPFYGSCWIIFSNLRRYDEGGIDALYIRVV